MDRHLVPKNISNNTGRSFSPQISSIENIVYVVWQDDTDNDVFDIFFTFSHDSGQTLDYPPDNLSNSTGKSENPQISSTTKI